MDAVSFSEITLSALLAMYPGHSFVFPLDNNNPGIVIAAAGTELSVICVSPRIISFHQTDAGVIEVRCRIEPTS